MDGFKNTTKTSYSTTAGRAFARGGSMTVSRNDMAGGEGPMNKPAMVAKYAKGGHVKKGEQKIGRVMEEFTKGKLHSGSKDGPKVKSTKQAVAIALNEARAAGAKIPRVKKAYGGSVEGDDVLMARMTKDELAQGAKGVRMARERMEKQTVKKGVPPSSSKPLISDRMKEVGKSIGVTKKAAGGGVKLGNAPMMSVGKTLGNNRMVDTGNGMRASSGPITLGNAPMKTVGKTLGTKTLRLKEGGVAKKANGGIMLGNAPMMKVGTTLGTNRMVDTGAGMRASTGPRTLGNAPMISVGRKLGTNTLRLNKGGLSVMPKGKGCK